MPANGTHEQFVPPLTEGNKLKAGDRLTVVVLSAEDQNRFGMQQQIAIPYHLKLMCLSFDPAPPLIEERCEVEVVLNGEPVLNEDQQPLVGTVIATRDDLAWVRYRLGGDEVIEKRRLRVILAPKK